MGWSLYKTMGRAITGMYFNTCSLTSARVVTWEKYPLNLQAIHLAASRSEFPVPTR